MKALPNIEYKKRSQNPTVDSDSSYFELPFYKTEDYFYNWDNTSAFANAVERLVYRSNQYARYISFLKEQLGLNHCQVLSNINDEDAPIEMHHGPILTLFDYATIMIDYHLYHDRKMTTFSIADLLIEEHFNNIIQVVMLSETIHEEVHENNIFLNKKHGFGDIEKFIKKYREGFSPDIIEKINKYIEFSYKVDSYDKNVLSLEQCVKKWIKPREDTNGYPVNSIHGDDRSSFSGS